MSNKDLELYDTNKQFGISYELICLLKWILDNDTTKLKKIVAKSLSSGLKEELKDKNSFFDEEDILEDIKETILEFFATMEEILIDALNDQARKKAVEKNLIPDIEKIDSNICDDATVKFSIEKATSKIDNNPKENPKELLFKELLKRWKPNKKNILN
jgi:hypothetical protein